MTPDCLPVIIGAGPAGTRAAERLVAAGLRPVVIDEAAASGGQIYRRPPSGFERGNKALYGSEAAKAEALHSVFDRLLPRIDHRPGTTVWNLEPGQLATWNGREARTVPYTHLILAPGATDRLLPVPGWTLPGVFSLGGAQVALKAQGCAIGERIAFAGTGPLLYLVAWQYLKAGAQVVAVVDTGRLRDRLRGAPLMAARPRVLLRGIGYALGLRRAGVILASGASDLRIDGAEAVTSLRWTSGGRARSAKVDAVGLGFGLRSETQLADLADCRFVYDALEGAWLPALDRMGRSSVPGMYLAGDGTGIHGADAAEAAGARAAQALLDDLAGTPSHAGGCQRFAWFRRGLARSFPLPLRELNTLPDSTLVCRCEEIDAGQLRRAIHAHGLTEINRLKAVTRAGMGRCQGRFCGTACQALLAAEAGCAPEATGRLRAQAPLRPVPLAALMHQEAGND